MSRFGYAADPRKKKRGGARCVLQAELTWMQAAGW
jgi:hypothetical protein